MSREINKDKIVNSALPQQEETAKGKMVTYTNGYTAFDGRVWIEGRGWKYVSFTEEGRPCICGHQLSSHSVHSWSGDEYCKEMGCPCAGFIPLRECVQDSNISNEPVPTALLGQDEPELSSIVPLSRDQITPEIRLMASRCILSSDGKTIGGFSEDAHKYAAYTIIREQQLLQAKADLTQALTSLAAAQKELQSLRNKESPENAWKRGYIVGREDPIWKQIPPYVEPTKIEQENINTNESPNNQDE
jgi:hypothetical protein